MTDLPPEIHLKILSSSTLSHKDILHCMLAGPPLTDCAEEAIHACLPVDGRRHVLFWLKYFIRCEHVAIWTRDLNVSLKSGKSSERHAHWNRLLSSLPNLKSITFTQTKLSIFVEAWTHCTLNPVWLHFVDCEFDCHGLSMLLSLPCVSSVDIDGGHTHSGYMIQYPLVQVRSVCYILRVSIGGVYMHMVVEIASCFPTSEPAAQCLTWQVMHNPDRDVILKSLDIGLVDQFLTMLRLHLRGALWLF